MSGSYVYVISRPPLGGAANFEIRTGHAPFTVEVTVNGETAAVSAQMLKNAIDAADQNCGNLDMDND